MKRSIYIAVFAISFSLLMFEVILLKFFSFKMISSWAFLIFSIALLGIGASGTYVYLKKSDNLKKMDFSFLSNFSTAYTISIPLSIMLFAWIPFSPPSYFVLQNVIFSFFYMVLFSIPFFFSGICVSYILSFKEFHSGRVLFFDLMGAGFGCICSVMFLRFLGAYGILSLAMALAYLASIIFSFLSAKINTKSSFTKIKIFLPISLCLILFAYPHIMIRIYGFDVISTNREEHYFRTFKEDFGGIAATYWNPISRIDLSREGQSDRYVFLFGLSEKYRNKKYIGRYILLDSGAATRQFRFDGDEKDKEFFAHFLFSVPYRLMNNINDVLIIGPGGGLEILIGKYFKVKHIDAVDINSDIIDILTGRNKNDEMSEIYSRFTLSDSQTMVKYYAEEGRAFLSKNATSRYDVVQLTGVDLLSALMSGGMVLSESYLYTEEALGYYYDALKENGFMQISYWGGPWALRLFITALEMLSTKGIERPSDSLIVVDDKTLITTLIVKKGLFSSAEVMEIRKICETDDFGILFMPQTIPGKEEYAMFGINSKHYLLASDNNSRESLLKILWYNVKPTYDDRPFFYSISSPKKRNILRNILVTLFESKIIMILISIGMILAFVVILLPFIIKGLKPKLAGERFFRLLTFFGIAGLAFPLIELVTLQKFAIFVGGPFFSMGIILPTILIFYSIGAFFTTKTKLPTSWLMVISTVSIALCGLLGYLLLDGIIKNFFYLTHLRRIVLVVMVISPLGFFLGIPIPTVLEAIKNRLDRSIVPWMWGISSCANVVGALFFAYISQITGFNLLLLISCCLYLVALLFLPYVSILKAG